MIDFLVKATYKGESISFIVPESTLASALKKSRIEAKKIFQLSGRTVQDPIKIDIKARGL